MTDRAQLAAELRVAAVHSPHRDLLLAAASAIEELKQEVTRQLGRWEQHVVNAGAIVSRYETENARLKDSLAFLRQQAAANAKRIAELEAWIDDTSCDCVDDWNRPRPQACDRCKVLGRDGRDLSPRERREAEND